MNEKGIDDKSMVEDIQTFLKEDGVEEESKVSNPVEEMALQYGWRPEGKKSAEEYIKYALDQFPERGEALSKQARVIENKEDELSKMKSVLDELSSHMKKQKEVAYQQALEDLRNQKKQAVQNGDYQAVEQLELQQANLQSSSSVPTPVVEFKERHNSWLNGTSFEDIEMQNWVLQRDQQLASRKLPPEEHMKVLEDHLYKKFPEYFNINEGRSKISSVDSLKNSNVSSGMKAKKNFTISDLSKEQKEVAEYLNSNGHMKISEYIQQLVETGDLK